MKLILYNATSIDGFIATKDGDSEWVSPLCVSYFEEEIRKAGCIIIGRKTFQQYEGDVYPFKGVLNIVMTKNAEISRSSKYSEKDVLLTNETPQKILEIAKEKGFGSVLLVGGGTINGSFLASDLIDEIIVDIHPLVLGNGIKMFEGAEMLEKFELTLTKELGEGIVSLRYSRVRK